MAIICRCRPLSLRASGLCDVASTAASTSYPFAPASAAVEDSAAAAAAAFDRQTREESGLKPSRKRFQREAPPPWPALSASMLSS
jgi:hypothetical protein